MFTTNKYFKPNSAIHLNRGYLTIPNGIYFYQDFTISVWIKPYAFSNWEIVIDVSNTIGSKRSDVIGLCYTTPENIGSPHLFMFDVTGSIATGITSSKALKIGEWAFLTAVLRGNTGYIYINGQQTATGYMLRPRAVTRVNNQIGNVEKLGFYEPLANAVIDDLKIFNRALDVNEITILMNSNKNLI